MLSIGVVARQTGIEIGTLRKWEERYGFPTPVRLESGQRRYHHQDVEKLLAVVRRLVAGERVGQVIREIKDPLDASKPLYETFPEAKQAHQSIESAICALLRHDLPSLQTILEEAKGLRGMAAFVEDIAGPLTRQVGEYWAGGALPIYVEHHYSAVLDSFLLREASRFQAETMKPTVLLTTPSDEHHTLGLSMVNAVLSEAGVTCLRLSGGLPVSEIAAAADAYQVKVVGVSVTCLYPPKLLSASIVALRNALSPRVGLWFGGAGVNKVCQLPTGVTTFASMYELRDACATLNLSNVQNQETNKATK